MTVVNSSTLPAHPCIMCSHFIQIQLAVLTLASPFLIVLKMKSEMI